MKAYYDTDKDNLSDIIRNGGQIAVDNGDNVKYHLSQTGTMPVVSNDYSERGAYIINVTGFADNWSGNYDPYDVHIRHILYEVPDIVISAARLKKIIIVINSQAEGFPLIYRGVDGFREMHKAMTNLKLPAGSVLLIDANRDTGTDYDLWRAENKEPKMFEHIHFLTCFYYFENRMPASPLVLSAVNSKTSKDFNALNRTVRQHRIDFLYRLIKDNIHTAGLVSGHYNNAKNRIIFDELQPTYVNVSYAEYTETLMRHCPLMVDGNWYNDNPDSSKTGIFNHEIYSNSLMSFVTETAFHDTGMFLTEKVFKSIVAGHPFIVMGQHLYLDALEEMGYKVDFAGIDRRYDKIRSPHDRFNATYNELKKWVALSRGEKNRMISISLENIIHNQRLIKSKNYSIDSYQRLNSKLISMFDQYGQS